MTKARDIASAAPAPSTVSATEIGYLDGVSSAIQTQLDGKASTTADIPKSLIDAKGDLIVGSAADTAARLAVGTNDHVLTADSSATNGVKWAAPASGGGMTLIQESTASANSALDFSSISGSYKQLLLVWQGLYASTTGLSFSIRFNSSSASEYQTYHGGSQGSNSGYGSGNTTTTYIAYPDGNIPVTESAVTGIPTVGSLLIDNYASTTKHKFYEGRQFGEFSENNGKQAKYFGGSWKNTNAITSINIFRISASGTFSNNTNTSIRLYGIS